MNSPDLGTVLIPEGLVEFIPAMKRLIAELNDFLAANAEEFSHIKKSHQRDYIIVSKNFLRKMQQSMPVFLKALHAS